MITVCPKCKKTLTKITDSELYELITECFACGYKQTIPYIEEYQCA